MKETIEVLERTVITAEGQRRTEKGTVLKEHTLSVIVNGKRAFRLVCTKTCLKELVLGRLYNEGLIDTPSDIRKMEFGPSAEEACVVLNHEIPREEGKEAEPGLMPSRGYAACRGKRGLKQLPRLAWQPEWIFFLSQKFSEGKKLHRLTQGTHSCFLSRGERILFSCEDIGRHNTIDKAIGFGLLEEISFSECLLYTSGRTPADMVRTVISAGIPVLVSKAIPTAESVALAKKYGLTLICRAYPDQLEVFSGQEETTAPV